MNKIALAVIIIFLHLSSQAQSDSTFDIQGMLYKVSDPASFHVTYFDSKGKPVRNSNALSDIPSDLNRKIVKVLAETDFSNYFKVKNTDTLELTLSIAAGTNYIPAIRIIGDPALTSYDSLIKASVRKAISKEKLPLKQVSMYEINFFSIRMSPIKREKRSPGYKID